KTPQPRAFFFFKRPQPQLHVLIFRMSGDIFIVGQEDHPLSVGRDVREPVVEIIRRDLFLSAAVRLHAPDLHEAGALGVEVNIFAIRRVVWTIVEPLCGSETSLVAAGDWDGVDIEISISLSDESERGSIRGPAMPIGWGIF